MAGRCVQVMVLLLCFSYLVCNNGAIPVTRSDGLVKKSQTQSYGVAEDVYTGESGEEGLKMEERLMRRMEAEVNDYPGSGANNRHTPRPQLGRGCLDC